MQTVSCGNCKHWEHEPQAHVGICELTTPEHKDDSLAFVQLESEMNHAALMTREEFSCNQYETA
ncbi:hypothetical protein [Deinococcus cellulosilyticus]|uniref:Uncharacterized protein n=1 Tax=Deinococcus cellulosilyticus (strain DSM 18568 / NBRC 106333 / KACC 11606 / 5516J-15) TaxID=1223518 RepID=A0A511N0H4_DEIC1|nr:hypothetical protein [Deinococcus cellulosilyticus]GEM46390.1 hypothetical protein DC3_20250 [Deinococcus cellulosilyticus NBRC 106333 = KACC 11606]